MKRNIGDLDAYLRITGGLSMLGIGIICSSKLVTLIGSMKVAEGVTRYCPIMHMLGIDSLDWELKTHKVKEIELVDMD